MSGIIDTKELIAASDRIEATNDYLDGGWRFCPPKPSSVSDVERAGISVFGHTQVADAFLLWCKLTHQQRGVLAAKMAAYDAPAADRYAEQIIDAVFETGHHNRLVVAPVPDAARHERIKQMLKEVQFVYDADSDDESADDHMLVSSGILSELLAETQTATQPAVLAESYVQLDAGAIGNAQKRPRIADSEQNDS